jgi:uncharacterized membrane-anchored protein YhcB (DUF1043 family)
MLSNWKVGVALALLFSLYSGALIVFGYQKAETDHAKQDKLDLEAAVAHRDALQAQIDTMAGENADLINKLRNVQPEVYKHETQAQRSDICNLTLGAVSVLNARKGYPVGTPDNPRIPAGKDGAPSTVTGARAQTELESCEGDYQIAITRLNGLIDSCSVLQ